MRKSVEQIGREVLLKLAESAAMPPPPETTQMNVPNAVPEDAKVTPSNVPSSSPEQEPLAGPALPTQEELAELYRNTVMTRSLIGTGAGAIAGGAAGGLLTGWHPVGLLGGAAGLGAVGNRVGAAIGENAALKKLEARTGMPWTMPGKIPG